MTSVRRSKLEDAYQNRLLIRFLSPYEPGSTTGYVLDIGPQFFLLGYVNDEIRFDGFHCLRLADVRKLQVPSPHAEFVVKALQIREDYIEERPAIDLSSLPTLLRSAGKVFPLVTIHRERINPDTCKIGKVINVTDDKLQLLEIDPDALWEKRPTTVRLDDITRIEFGGGYEDALHLVGGAAEYPRPN